MPRIAPVDPPYDAETGRQLELMMPAGVPPIGLFRTFAKNLPMTQAMTTWGGYELSKAMSLTLRDREIVIDRTCARCSCEYEWGVHVAFFADAARLTRDQVASITHGNSNDDCWTEERDRLLIAATDSLHDESGLDDALYSRVATTLTEAELIDLTMLAGWYHAISYAATALQVELEVGAPRFVDYSSGQRP